MINIFLRNSPFIKNSSEAYYSFVFKTSTKSR